MSLGIVFKGPEGIVLAADSRVTLNAKVDPPGQPSMLLPATFDNATKLLKVEGQEFVGAITYGLGAIGLKAPRTAHSFMPEFEAELGTKKRFSVEDFAKRLGTFFMARWTELGMPNPKDWTFEPMVFLVGGYDEGQAYGRAFELSIPTQPNPTETMAGEGVFGALWGGQRSYVDRLMQGFDEQALMIVGQHLGLPPDKYNELRTVVKAQCGVKIPYQFLPLQDCVDLTIFLIRTTISIQTWVVDIRGVGGAIDVATITKTDGFKRIQSKTILGERET